MTGLNLSEGQLPIERKKAVLALLKASVLIAKKAGLQAAVIAEPSGINSNQPGVHNIFRELLKEGVLREGNLLQSITLSGPPSPSYIYSKVYVINDIPSLDLKAIQSPHTQGTHKSKDYIPFGEGIGLIRYNGDMTAEQAQQLRGQIEGILNLMPSRILSDLKTFLQDFGGEISVVIDPALDRSEINRSAEGVTIHIGKDVRENGHVDSVGLQQMVAEAIISFAVPDYNALKRRKDTDENAYFKLEVLKHLLNYRSRTPLYHKFMSGPAWGPGTRWDDLSTAERTRLQSTYQQQLDQFTEGWTGVYQYNIFLNVMNDADPEALIQNYIHLLFRAGAAEDPEEADKVYRLINQLKDTDIGSQVSIARVRNVMKAFFFDGIARVPFAGQISMKDRFTQFDDTDKLDEWKDILLATQDTARFYETLTDLMRYVLPISEKATNREIQDVFGRKIERMEPSDREEAIRGWLRELLMRHLGEAAYISLQTHMLGERGDEQIPPITADLRARTGDWKDWGTELFPASENSETGSLFKTKSGLYEHYIASPFEALLFVGGPSAFIASIIRFLESHQSPSDLVSVLLVGISALVNAIVGGILFAYAHKWMRGNRIFKAHAVRSLAWDTGLAGLFVGAAIAMPASWVLARGLATIGAAVSVSRLLARHFVINNPRLRKNLRSSQDIWAAA